MDKRDSRRYKEDGSHRERRIRRHPDFVQEDNDARNKEAEVTTPNLDSYSGKLELEISRGCQNAKDLRS